MALPLNIDDLIHQRKVEGARIEYKKDWNPEKVLHSVCAFANDIDNWGGGYIRSRFYRNRRIGEFLKELDLAEGRNTGIGKIVRAMRENGSPPPEFYNPETRSFMTVILPIHEAFKAEAERISPRLAMTTEKGVERAREKDLPENLPENLPETLTPSARRVYLKMKQQKGCTYDSLASAIGVTRETIRVSIASLVKHGLIRRVGPDKGGHWEVVGKE